MIFTDVEVVACSVLVAMVTVVSVTLLDVENVTGELVLLCIICCVTSVVIIATHIK